jgi:hypothetical protein
MATPSSEQQETLLFFKNANEEFMVRVQELFLMSTGDVNADAKILADSWTSSADMPYQSVAVNHPNMPMAKIMLPSTAVGADDTYVASAIVQPDDNMLILLQIYASTRDTQNKEKYLSFADNVLNSIQKGTKTVNQSARTEKLWFYEVDIPADYSFVYQQGPDFDVYYMRKTVAMDSKTQPTMGIYIGGHPSFNPEIDGAKKSNDTIVGQAMEWVSYEKDGVFHAEAMFTVSGSDGLMTHVFISADTEAELETLKAIARTLTPTN